MPRLIKRYENRKLYDLEAKRYLSLQEIGALVRKGHEVAVIDNVSGRDITAQTLAKVIAGQERRGRRPPSEILHEIVRWGGQLVAGAMGRSHLEEMVLNSLQRVAPVRELRQDVARLREQLEKLEVLLEQREGQAGQAAAETGKR